MNTLLDPIPVISRRMIIFLNIALVVIPLFNLIVWSQAGTHFFTGISNALVFLKFHPLEVPILGGAVNPSDIQWTTAAKGVMLLSKTIQLTPLMIGLFLLKLIFKNYKKEDVFVVQNAQYYQWIGYLIFIGSMASYVSKMLVTSAFHYNGQVVNYDFSLTTGFIALLVLVISQVMLEGSRLREENQLTV